MENVALADVATMPTLEVIERGSSWMSGNGTRKRRSRKPQETYRRNDINDADNVVADHGKRGDVVDKFTVQNKSPVISDEDGLPRCQLLQGIPIYPMLPKNNRTKLSRNSLSHAAAACMEMTGKSYLLQHYGDGNKQYDKAKNKIVQNVNKVNWVDERVGEAEDDDLPYAEDFSDFDHLANGFPPIEDDQILESGAEEASVSLSRPASSSNGTILQNACDVCGGMFKNRAALSSHAKTHQRRTLRCQVCAVSFTSQGMLLWHRRFVHAEQKYNHQCEVCGETVRLKQELASHYMTHRLARGVVRCTTCEQPFRNLVTLRLHELHMCLGKPVDKKYVFHIIISLSTFNVLLMRKQNNNLVTKHLGILKVI